MLDAAMHYYPHHIGDYRSGTMHLSNEEDLAYRRLLEMYYDTEQPIPLETQWVARRLRVGTEALESVLRDFFTRTEEGFRNAKCDLVIREYHEMAEKNRRNGSKGGRPKANKQAAENPVGSESVASGNPVETHSKANQEPITNNQKPNKKKKAAAAAVSAPQGMDAKVWEDWLAIRRAKSLPLTETAWEQMVAEAGKAGLPMETVIRECCLRGWGAFKASWWEREKSLKNQGDRNADVLRGLTRGLVGGTSNVKLLGE